MLSNQWLNEKASALETREIVEGKCTEMPLSSTKIVQIFPLGDYAKFVQIIKLPLFL